MGRTRGRPPSPTQAEAPAPGFSPQGEGAAGKAALYENSFMKGLASGEGFCHYTVQPGDTLWDIARRFRGGGQNWPSLYKDNQDVVGGNPNLIFPGQQLNVCEAPPPRRGLDAYEVVPDDFVGPLAPGQIRQSEHDELAAFQFGDFDVVGDDFVGPFSNTQMTQAQYDQLQTAWLRMRRGQGLALQGSEADQTTFKQMLRDGMVDSPQFRQMFIDIASDPDHTVTMDLGRSQDGIKVDAFEWEASQSDPANRSGQRGVQTIDLDDYEAIPGDAPAGHPNAQTRTQKLIHALTEAHHGVSSTETDAGARYHAAHEAAIDAENAYRAEQGQGGQRGYDDPHGIPGGAAGDWRYDFDNGFIEDWDWNGNDLDGISYQEPAGP